ncbi:MAG TPA: hypothetical protein VHI13_05150 [Candidatus Kapabacteria bacterium]|nr:hypothetical protein [Candidatus Kapabacteria bacterium]
MPESIIPSLPGIGALLLIAAPRVLDWMRDRRRTRLDEHTAEQQVQGSYQRSTLESATQMMNAFGQWVQEMGSAHERCEERVTQQNQIIAQQQQAIAAMQTELHALRTQVQTTKP